MCVCGEGGGGIIVTGAILLSSGMWWLSWVLVGVAFLGVVLEPQFSINKNKTNSVANIQTEI